MNTQACENVGALGIVWSDCELLLVQMGLPVGSCVCVCVCVCVCARACVHAPVHTARMLSGFSRV